MSLFFDALGYILWSVFLLQGLFLLWFGWKIALAYRNIPENIEIMPNCDHRELHAKNQPPPMPSIETMKEAIVQSALNRSKE